VSRIVTFVKGFDDFPAHPGAFGNVLDDLTAHEIHGQIHSQFSGDFATAAAGFPGDGDDRTALDLLDFQAVIKHLQSFSDQRTPFLQLLLDHAVHRCLFVFHAVDRNFLDR
jgi:hypothetical protein